MTTIEMYADLACPFAYLVHARWRQVRHEFAGSVDILHRCLALEYVNREPTSKPNLDVELPVLLLEEPEISWSPWQASLSTWPVTLWPAFEAVKCAEQQSLRLADDLAFAIRVAFFAENRCISLRHVLLDLAECAGLAMPQFETDLDGGVCKNKVVKEAKRGWEVLRVPGSPTWVLPSGEQINDFGLPELDIDATGRPVLARDATCQGAGCLDHLKLIINRAVD